MMATPLFMASMRNLGYAVLPCQHHHTGMRWLSRGQLRSGLQGGDGLFTHGCISGILGVRQKHLAM